MSTTELIDLDVCQDCILVIANGEHGDCDGTCRSCTTPTPEGYWVLLGGDELGFTSRACELCGQDLAGDRYRAYLDPR